MVIGLWTVTALVAAAVRAASSALQKHLTEDYGTLELSFITMVSGAVFLAPVAVWAFLTFPLTLTPAVAGATLVSGIVNILALVAVVHSLRLEDLSVVGPLRQLTPVLVVLLEPVVLGADLGTAVYGGAVAAAAGSYLLLADGTGILAPLRRLNGRGAQLAFAAAGLYTVTSLADRYATTRLSPYLFTVLLYIIMIAGLAAVLAWRDELPSIDDMLERKFALLGLLMASGSVLIFYSFSVAAASQVTIMLQTVVLLNVLLGSYIFEESYLLQRLTGSGLIVIAVYLAM